MMTTINARLSSESATTIAPGMIAVALLMALLLALPAWAQTKKVAANMEIFGGGYKSVTTSDGTGILPTAVTRSSLARFFGRKAGGSFPGRSRIESEFL